jgi:hypothetical protein
MTYEQLKDLKPSAFKRRCGVHRETFDKMVKALRWQPLPPRQTRRAIETQH